MIKVDDYVICHTIPSINYTVGKKYQISKITDDILYVQNDLLNYIIFTFKEDYNNSYKKWFKNIKENRLEKLKKLDLC